MAVKLPGLIEAVAVHCGVPIADWLSVDDMADAVFASPLYIAVIECVPIVRFESDIEAAPDVSGAVPMVCAPFLNVIVPVANAGTTRAVNVTAVPTVAGLADEATVTLAVDGATVRATVRAADTNGPPLGPVVASVAVIDRLNVPDTVGVPPITPVAATYERPVGNPVTTNVYGAAPPDAVSVGEIYDVPTVADGTVDVATFSVGAATSSVTLLGVEANGPPLIAAVASVAMMDAVKRPAAVGVPEMSPDVELKVSPPGKPVTANA